MCVWRKMVWGGVWIGLVSTSIALGSGKNTKRHTRASHSKKQTPPVASAPLGAETAQGTHKDLVYLAVSKHKLLAELRTLPEFGQESKVLQVFPVAIGKQEGDKKESGDHKTPEGIYFAGQHLDTSRLSPIEYGTRAIPLDFPNLLDRQFGVTGSGIWLHGAGDDKRMASAQVTRGCVVFHNEDLLKLLPWLNPYQGIVSIAQDLPVLNQPEAVKEVETATKQWLHAWANKQLDPYVTAYAASFHTQGRNRSQFRAYKKNLFARYHKMVVKMDTIRTLTHPKYAVTIMNQHFNGNGHFVSNGRKILYWQKLQNRWQIVGELFDSHRFEPVQYSFVNTIALKK